MSKHGQENRQATELNNICQHEDCLLSAAKGMLAGLYFGGKVRFMHQLVMTILFKRQSIAKMLINVLNATFDHAVTLGSFVFLYKIIVCIINSITKKKSKLTNFVAGYFGGLQVFGKQTPIGQQINLYLLSRNITGGCVNLQRKNLLPQLAFYPILAALTWGLVMFLFEDKPRFLQQSLTDSMKFLYKESDKPLTNWSQLIPVDLPPQLIKYLEILLV